MPRQIITGYLSAALVVLIWSGFIVVSRIGGKGTLNAFDITALRFGVAGLLLAPVMIWRGIGALTLQRLAVLTVFAGFGYALLAYSAFRFAPAAHGSILLPGALPFEAAIFAALLLGERPDRRRQLALALIALGIACLAVQSLAVPVVAGPHGPVWVGDLLFLGASSCWALFTVLVRRWQVSAIDAAVGVQVGAMVAYLPVYLLWLPKSIAAAPWSEILLQGVYQGVLASFVAMALYTRATRAVGATQVATMMAVVPALSALLAVPLLGEALTPALTAGIALVTFGALLGSRPAVPAARLPEAAAHSGRA
jgi:drug/metabolite transporter (DMT)-like permease